MKKKVEMLLKKGVKIISPETVEIGNEVDIDRIGKGVIIHAGCKIYGPDTYIDQGTELGSEATVSVYNCYIGKNVKLKGGVFYKSTFLDGVSIGLGAQIREGCLLEEKARCAHTVGLKQTILFPYVTLGSLINFCDCLMAGGTDEKNHSEVGSSYIHFNYTPNQDKATASLIGDVPRGVMLREPPIFLGGQGGIVGPVRIGYGVVVAAGTIVRKDLLEENTLFIDYPARVSKKLPFHRGFYPNPKRIFRLNILYIANLIALRRWYLDIRNSFMNRIIFKGAIDTIDTAIAERIKRLREVAYRMPDSIRLHKRIKGNNDRIIKWKERFYEKWPEIERYLLNAKEIKGDSKKREDFLKAVEASIKENGYDYIQVIKGLKEEDAKKGTEWLQNVVDEILKESKRIIKD